MTTACVTPGFSQAMAPKVVKGVKSNDLRMFFGPGGSQPKPVPAVQVSGARVSFVLQVDLELQKKSGTQDDNRYVESLVNWSF